MTSSTSQDAGHVLTAIDHALDDYETSADAMRWTPEADEIAEAAPATLVPQHWTDIISADVERAFARMARAITDMAPALQGIGPILERARHIQRQQQHQRQHGGPMPLPIDGHEYRRRQRARRRR